MGIFAIGLCLLATLGNDTELWNLAWRMAVCGIGIGLFQTPNNVTITTSAPIQRSGGASGMLGTAIVAILFHYMGQESGGEVVCLWTALGLALISGGLSCCRIKEHSPIHK